MCSGLSLHHAKHVSSVPKWSCKRGYWRKRLALILVLHAIVSVGERVICCVVSIKSIKKERKRWGYKLRGGSLWRPLELIEMHYTTKKEMSCAHCHHNPIGCFCQPNSIKLISSSRSLCRFIFLFYVFPYVALQEASHVQECVAVCVCLSRDNLTSRWADQHHIYSAHCQ